LNQKNTKEGGQNQMSIIKLGNPPLPVKLLANGRGLAKLEHLWQAARRFARRRGYKVIESYGVVGVASF
jgi:hypothetical protein